MPDLSWFDLSRFLMAVSVIGGGAAISGAIFGLARRYEEGLGSRDADPQVPGVEVTPRETAPRPHHAPVQRARRRPTTLHVVRGGQGLRH